MGRATVLVVDDEPKIRDVVCSYLEREGFAVLQADSGQRALEAVARAQPDLVVLDLMLPDLPGEEVARSLRSASEVPIIMLSAKAGADYASTTTSLAKWTGSPSGSPTKATPS